MSEINSNDILLINKLEDSIESIEISNTDPQKDFDNLLEDSSNINETDIELFMKELDELPCCLNEFLEQKMKSPKKRFLLIELRNRNIKIKFHSMIHIGKEIFICNFCKNHWFNPYTLKEIEINLAETNSSICVCALENHDFLKQKTIFNDLNDEIKQEIEVIRKLTEDYTIQNPVIKAKEKILNLIKDKDNDTKLKIISSLMNIKINFFAQLDYNDEIFSNAFSCLKENKHYSSYNNIIDNYLLFFFFNHINLNETPIFVFEDYYLGVLPPLNYNNPDYFSHSFYFQAYRKQIISNLMESNKVISFLRKKGLDNDIICSHMMNTEGISIPFIVYGFFSLDSISNLNGDELSKFKQNLRPYIYIISSIFRNQLYEIFFDFLKCGKSNHISLLDKSNQFSKIFLEAILELSRILIIGNFHTGIIQVKNILNNYLLYMFNFIDENKIPKIVLLSSFSLSLNPHQNIFDDIEERKNCSDSDINKQKEYYKEIFNRIDDNINYIIKGKKTRKNDSLHNIVIVAKLLKIYKIKINYDEEQFKIQDLYYDFNELLQNIIEKDYPTTLVDKVIQVLNGNHQKMVNMLEIINHFYFQ